MSQCHAIKFLSAFTALQDSFLLRKACFTFAKAITAVSTVPNSSDIAEHGNRNILNSVAELSTDANRTPCYLLPGHVLRGDSKTCQAFGSQSGVSEVSHSCTLRYVFNANDAGCWLRRKSSTAQAAISPNALFGYSLGKSLLLPQARQMSSGSIKSPDSSRPQMVKPAASGVISSAESPTPAKPWLEGVLPKHVLPYAHLMRLDKPIGTWLLAWPCFWSIALAAPEGCLPDLKLLALFGTGALLLRGAGCTVNDLWDMDLDKKVDRTKGRPLASGTLTPRQGLGLLSGQLLLGLGILVQLNSYSIALGASSLGLVFTYPLMKRLTYWPQAYLGFTFNWGALLGYAAVQGSCDWPVVLPLYLGGVCWTLVYDTIYAHQDKADDWGAGVKSTALLFGQNTRPWLSGFALGATSLWALSGIMTDSGSLFYAGVAASGCHMAWQIWTTDLDSRADCMAKFVSNKWLGSLFFGGIALDKLL